ncbi:hypothetical protein SEPCBS119000_000614 [Sporothrix epigloea]|uniref:Uncharacterized protein n=1 Tax=Sporothrix epigloea TaxID=1892477 RepID=A0ABP0D8N0_9PEZI
MPEWTKEMADVVAKHQPVCTVEPTLPVLMGRGKVDSSYWYIPGVPAGASPAPQEHSSSPATPVVSEPVKTEAPPLSSTVRMAPYTSGPTSYRFSGSPHGKESSTPAHSVRFDENTDKDQSESEELDARHMSLISAIAKTATSRRIGTVARRTL